jgi:glycine/sarcosine/betaine reductase complex component C subunit beta
VTSGRASILGASLTLQHVPDLVRHGSKPSRELDRLDDLLAGLRSFEEAVAYPPNQVCIGNLAPESLRDLPRPWWRAGPARPLPTGPFGEILDQPSFYELLVEVDQFELMRMGREPRPTDLPLYADGHVVGAVASAHDQDASLTPSVLLENLACKAGAVHALRHLLARTDVDPDSIAFVLGAGEEAIGDRYQRGGGNLAKAVAEASGLRQAGGADVKAFCAAPVHAIVLAGALVEAGVHDRVAIVAGGSLAKLGMKFQGALEHGGPILDDVLASTAILVGVDEQRGPAFRLDAVGRHRVASGSNQQALLADIVGAPLDALGRKITDIDVYATELQNPEITEPAGGGDVPDRNYRMLAAIGVVRGELERDDMDRFVERHGLPGFSPTQGHIASSVPWLPHALDRFASGRLRTTMLLAKGSLFLGRMTHLWDGASITLEV